MNPIDLPPAFTTPVLSDELCAEISEEASRCVACGLCLPHCPTYRITQSEADSPRGRIALMSGAMSGRIPVNARFVLHMDRCLTCRACEAACPNDVHFGTLIDKTRAVLESPRTDLPEANATTSKPWLRKLVERELIAKPERIDLLRPFFRFYQRMGLQNLVRHTHLLGKTKLALLESQLPPVAKPCVSDRRTGAKQTWQEIYPSTGKQRGEVGLFLGCVARLTDAVTINAAVAVLNRLGYTVHVPRLQTCCGALHQHGGELEEAQKLVSRNITAFDGLNLQAIISTASGCGAQLAEHFSPPSRHACQKPHPTPGERDTRAENSPGGQAGGLIAKVMDISTFLATAEGWQDSKLEPLPHKIAVHEPCSLRNVLHGSAHPYTLLARIPEARIVPLAGNDQCCGAAGTYFIDQPEMSEALLDHKLDALSASGARYLATSNVGCAMHMGTAIRNAGLEIEVVHPVTLLARQMA